MLKAHIRRGPVKATHKERALLKPHLRSNVKETLNERAC